jgi:hypothetical protein
MWATTCILHIRKLSLHISVHRQFHSTHPEKWIAKVQNDGKLCFYLFAHIFILHILSIWTVTSHIVLLYITFHSHIVTAKFIPSIKRLREVFPEIKHKFCVYAKFHCVYHLYMDIKFNSAYLANTSQKDSLHTGATVVPLPDSLHVATMVVSLSYSLHKADVLILLPNHIHMAAMVFWLPDSLHLVAIVVWLPDSLHVATVVVWLPDSQNIMAMLVSAT